MNSEMEQLLNKVEEIGDEFENYQKKLFDDKFEPIKAKIDSIISEKLKELLDNPNTDTKDIEYAYYRLINSIFKIGHKEYGNKIEKNLQGILKNVFENKGVTIEGPKPKVGDIIIIKNNKKLVIEVKSLIDRTSYKSPQSIVTLKSKKSEIERSYEYGKFIVFAHACCNRLKDETLEQYLKNDWIILLSYKEKKDGEIKWPPIWEKEDKYYPLGKLINEIKEYFNFGKSME